jgi:hypothetical protein
VVLLGVQVFFVILAEAGIHRFLVVPWILFRLRDVAVDIEGKNKLIFKIKTMDRILISKGHFLQKIKEKG